MRKEWEKGEGEYVKGCFILLQRINYSFASVLQKAKSTPAVKVPYCAQTSLHP